MKPLLWIICICTAIPSFAKGHFDKTLSKDIWPRDIFQCLEHHNCHKPIRGWKLVTEQRMIFDGSVDSEIGVFTAQKGNERRYFWYSVESGVDGKTDQSISSTRVKQLDSPEENPDVKKLTLTGFWSDDHSLAWNPSSEENIGFCITNPLTDLPMAWGPVSKEDCGSRKGWRDCTDVNDCHDLLPVTLKPYKETSKKSECDFAVDSRDVP